MTEIFYIRRILFTGDHNLSNPYVKIKQLDTKDLILTTKNEDSEVTNATKDNEIVLKFGKKYPLHGDISIYIKNRSTFSKKYSGFYAFNTGFLT